MSCELPDVQWLSAKTEARAGATQEEDGEAVGASSGGGMSTVGRRRIILAQDGRVPGASRIPGFLNGGQEGSTPSTLKNQKTQETNTRRTAARSGGSVAGWQGTVEPWGGNRSTGQFSGLGGRTGAEQAAAPAVDFGEKELPSIPRCLPTFTDLSDFLGRLRPRRT